MARGCHRLVGLVAWAGAGAVGLAGWPVAGGTSCCSGAAQPASGAGQFGSPGYWDARFAQLAARGLTEEWAGGYAAIKAHLNFTRKAQVLHLGAGMSLLPFRMHQDGFLHQTCIDISARAVEAMQQECASQGVPLHYQQADASSLDCFADASFDLVVDKGTLDPFFDVEQSDGVETVAGPIVCEAHRVLKSGGSFVIITLHGDRAAFFRGLCQWKSIERASRPDLRGHCHVYTLQKP